jgi:pilus assembly protein CpaF
LTPEHSSDRQPVADPLPPSRLAGLPLFGWVPPPQDAGLAPPRLAPVGQQQHTGSPAVPPATPQSLGLAPVPGGAAVPAAAPTHPLPTGRAGLAHAPLQEAAAPAPELAGTAGRAHAPLRHPGPTAHEAAHGLLGPAPLPTPTAVPGLVAGRDQRREPAGGAGHPGASVDWAQVRAFRQQAAELLTGQLRDRTGLDETSRREIGRALIVAMLRDHADSLLAEGGQPPSPAQEHALAVAVFDALFGLGRLQPLVDDPEVENVEITGCDQVHLVYGDGRVQPGPPVADSDEELIETLAFLAARSGGRSGSGERAFSPANPILDLTLHGGARLAARAWITPRPTVVIRRHRLTDVDLDDLRALGMLDDALVAFLSAAVRAGKTIVVSGAQGAGKTTLVRALCNEMDPWERIGTIETEYELHLHELPDRHRRVVAHEARPGTGERTADGRAAGEVTLDDLLYSSLRLNLSRVIVGEVRGREVIPMFKAMQAGAGSLSTTHAHDARAAIERLVTCALEAGPHVTQDFAYLQIASHIDLIVHIGMHTETAHRNGVPTGAGGRKHRYVSQVIEPARGEGGRPAVTDVFAPGPDGRAMPRTRPSFLPDLQRAGFDPAWLDTASGTWPDIRHSADELEQAAEGRR